MVNIKSLIGKLLISKTTYIIRCRL